jgi:hypothetical protein
MESLAGAVLVLIGLFFVFFGHSNLRSSGTPRSMTLPAWMDRVIQWAIALMCLWFGVALMLGRVSFY